jgi:hypothetical protein
MSREPGIGHVPPKMIRPNLIAICTNGGRHRRIELLRLAVVIDAQGRPGLVQSMSAQRGKAGAAQWTAIQSTVRAGDGHHVISKPCPLCPHHLKWRVDKLTAAIGKADPGACKVVDISGP